MFTVSTYLDHLNIYEVEEIPAHVIMKGAVADISSREDGSQWIVSVEKKSGTSVDILMGEVSEKSDWTNDISGAARAVSFLVTWVEQ